MLGPSVGDDQGWGGACAVKETLRGCWCRLLSCKTNGGVQEQQQEATAERARNGRTAGRGGAATGRELQRPQRAPHAHSPMHRHRRIIDHALY